MPRTELPRLDHQHVCNGCVYHDCPDEKCPALVLRDAWRRWDGRGDGPRALVGLRIVEPRS